MTIKRIESMIKKKRSDIEDLSVWTFLCFFTIIIPICAINSKEEKKKDIEELEFVKSVAVVRRAAAGPRAKMSLPAELKKKSRKSTVNDSYVFYSHAAACGILATGGGGACGG